MAVKLPLVVLGVAVSLWPWPAVLALVARRQIALIRVTPGDETAFGNLRVTAMAVPHRDDRR